MTSAEENCSKEHISTPIFKILHPPYPLPVKNIIEGLNLEVEFPDIRFLVNTGKLSFGDMMTFKKNQVNFVHGFSKKASAIEMQ
jgi:hypothetical protein